MKQHDMEVATMFSLLKKEKNTPWPLRLVASWLLANWNENVWHWRTKWQFYSLIHFANISWGPTVCWVPWVPQSGSTYSPGAPLSPFCSRISHKWNCPIYNYFSGFFSFLFFFTRHNVFEVIWCCTYQSVAHSFLGCVVFHCMAVSRFVSPSTCWRMFGLFLVWGIIINTGGQVFLCPVLSGVHLGVELLVRG